MIGWSNIEGGGLDLNKPLIRVSAPIGSTVDFKLDNIIVKTIPSAKAFPNIDGETASYYYSVSVIGTYTVIATLNNRIMSKEIIVNTVKQYDVNLRHEIMFVENGVLTDLTWVIATNPSYPGAAVTQETWQVLFTTGSWYAATVFGSTDAFDLTDFTTLRLTIISGQSYYLSNQVPCVGIGRDRPTGTGTSASVTNFDYKTMLNTSTGNILFGTYTLDVSTLTGAFYVGLCVSGTAASSFVGAVRVIEFGIY